jgi:ribosomal protein L11 methyltransferase
VEAWWQVVVTDPGDATEGVVNFLWEQGAVGVVEEESPTTAPGVRAFFPGTTDADDLAVRVRDYVSGLRALGFPGPLDASVSALGDPGWATAWREHFRPRSVGRSLLIAPPWDPVTSAGRHTIVIEPGRAFGTGQHATTVGCLERLEDAVAADAPPRALDVGTGSGILAIAAARLGVPDVLAVDDDPDAVENARVNTERNGVAARVRCLVADATAVEAVATPLLLANLLAPLHRRLAGRYADLVAADGTLILGGILDNEAAELEAHVAGHGFAPVARLSREGWSTLELRRSPHAPIHRRA